jgi:N-acetylneuraminate synthase/N,N'-diacetyllegionaminate synthase
MKFSRKFKIGTRNVGGGAPVLIIAEAGVAHFGDIVLARELVAMAAIAKADVFKIQIFDVDALIARTEHDWRERLRPRSLSLDQVLELKELAVAKGMEFMATAHDESRLEWLQMLNVPAIKIGSGERGNIGFVKKLAGLGKPLIISTGMYGVADVKRTLAACFSEGCQDVALLHCVTAYPTPPHDVNLAAMDTLRQLYDGPVGYSDHTTNFLTCYAAVARGAEIIEKHITILRNVPNAQDWKVSAGPEDFSRFVMDIRHIEQLIGEGKKQLAPSEAQAEFWALKSIVAICDLPKGKALESSDLAVKRPGGGIPPYELEGILGKRLKRALMTDEKLKYDDLA